MNRRRVRFGAKLRAADDRAGFVAEVARIEALGFSTVLVPDHFGEQWAPTPTLAAAAAVTTRLRVGTSVLGNDFRNPVVLAHEAATIDTLSGGRLELGLGAGWDEDADYRPTGIPFDRPGRRIDRLEQTLSVLAERAPDVHRMVGGGGPKVLDVAARMAHTVCINPQVGAIDATSTTASLDDKVATVRDVDPDVEIGIQVYSGHPPQSPFSIPADPDELAARVDRWGITYWILPPERLDAIEVLRPATT